MNGRPRPRLPDRNGYPGLSSLGQVLFNVRNSEDMGVVFKKISVAGSACSRRRAPMTSGSCTTRHHLHYMNVRDEGTGINLLGDAIRSIFTEAAESMSRYGTGADREYPAVSHPLRVGNTRLGITLLRKLLTFGAVLPQWRSSRSAHYHALDPSSGKATSISMHMDRMTLLTHLRQE